MATGSVSDRAFSTRAKIDVSGRSFPSVPAFSEEVISEKNPRHWCDLPEHLLLRIFDFLTQDDEKGRDWVSPTEIVASLLFSSSLFFCARV